MIKKQVKECSYDPLLLTLQMEDIDNLITLHFIRRLQPIQLYLSNENFKSLGELKAVSLSDKKTAKILKYEEIRTLQFYLTLKIYIWRVKP